MTRRRLVPPSPSSSSALNRRQQRNQRRRRRRRRDLPFPSFSSGRDRHRGDGSSYSCSSDDFLDNAENGSETASFCNNTHRYVQADVTTTKCGGIDATTSTHQRRLCAAYDGEHQVWHLVPPETLAAAAAAGEDNDGMSPLSEAGNHCPVRREKRSASNDVHSSHQEEHFDSETSRSTFICGENASRRVVDSRTVSDGDEANDTQNGYYVDDDVNTERRTEGKGQREMIKAGAPLEARVMFSGEENIPLKKKKDKAVAGDAGEERSQNTGGCTPTDFCTSTLSRVGCSIDREDPNSGSLPRKTSSDNGEASQPASWPPKIDCASNKVGAKSKTEMHERKSGDATCETTRSSEEEGSCCFVASVEKGRLEDCRVMVATACGQMTRTKKDAAEGAVLDMSDCHQRQKSGNSDVSEGVVRELNLAEGAGKEARKGKNTGAGVDGATASDGLSDDNNELILVDEAQWVPQPSAGSSTEHRDSRIRGLHPLTNQNGAMRPRAWRSLSIGRARVTWRGATVDLAETLAITLKETRPGQPRSENKPGRSNQTPESGLGGAKGPRDGDIRSSHKLPAASNEKKQPPPSWVSEGKVSSSREHLDDGPLASSEGPGFRAAASGGTEEGSSFIDGRRGSIPTHSERIPSTSHQNLAEGDAKPSRGRGRDQTHNSEAKDSGESKRGSRCSNDNEVLPDSLPAHSSNLSVRARPVFFLSTPYAGPPIADCPRAWPNGARALPAPSEPRFEEEAAKDGRERGATWEERSVEEQKGVWFPESAK